MQAIVEKIDNCFICINGTDYKTDSYIYEFVIGEDSIIIVTNDGFLFFNLKDNSISCVKDSLGQYSQLFTDDGKVIMSVKINFSKFILITDFKGIPLEIYLHNDPFGLNIKVFDKYVIGIRGPSHNQCVMYIFKRHDIRNRLKVKKEKCNSKSNHNHNLFYYVKGVYYPPKAYKMLYDGYNGFNNIKIFNDNLIYDNFNMESIRVPLN